MKTQKSKDYIWPVFMILSAVWAFWGCWKVKDILIDNIDYLGLLNDSIRSNLPKLPWYEKVVFGVAFIVVFLFWTTIPVQFIWIYSIVTEKDKTAGEKIKRLTQDIGGQILGMLAIISIWIGGVLFIAYFGGLLDILWILFLIGFVIYSLTSGLVTKLINLFKR